MATGVPVVDVSADDFEGDDIFLREMFMTDGTDEEFLGFDLNDMGSPDSEEDKTMPYNVNGDADVSNITSEFVWEP